VQVGVSLLRLRAADPGRRIGSLLLGDQKLSYLGYSYGSLLGQNYANLFRPGSGPW
jgi:pimeloyl-ACP methyl ester carboxylesterase